MSVAMTGTAWLFPGQGSQIVGMGRALAAADPAAAALFRLADETLGQPLSGTIFDGPAEALQQTDVQQPAIVVTSVAYLEALQRRGALPAAVVAAGHSLGQYSALVAVGSLTLPDALRLVAERGRLMQTHGRGAMAAILNLAPDVVASVAAEAGAEVANVNAPGQITISGREDAVARAVALAQARGARRVVALPVNAAFHSSLMQPVAQGLAPLIEAVAIVTPRLPILSNVDARPLTTADDVRRELLDHICAPVQWVATVEAMLADGVATFVEIGPGRVLSGLVRRVRREAATQDAEALLGYTEDAGTPVPRG
jgi:[acyl-carrier-protein] S-malonyltransferase